jgi:hypothetical protein
MLSAEAPTTEARKSANGSDAAGVGSTGASEMAGDFAAGLAIDVVFWAAGFAGCAGFAGSGFTE